MKGRTLRFRDEVSFRIEDNDYNLLKDAVQSTQKQGKTLQVDLAATHAGLIVLNNRLYPPGFVRAGADSFTSGYAKPILKHHDKQGDPIGRVVHAEYIDTSDSLLKEFGQAVFSDSNKHTNGRLKKFNDGSLSYEDQVDFILDNLNSKMLRNVDYKGFGYIKLTANIPDPDAQQKFLDGRYFTFSTSASTNRASCSICRQDLAKDGLCDHDLGAVYDDELCYLITGPLTYSECSVVNRPADTHSRILQLHQDDEVVDIPMIDTLVKEVEPVILKLSNIGMLDKEAPVAKKKDKIVVPDNVEPDKPVEDENTQPDNQDNVDTKPEENVEDQAVDTEDQKPDENKPEENQDEDETPEEFDDFLTRILDGEISDEDREKAYEFLAVDLAEDAKLSTESREKLPKSAFCGPDRSFPVPDCAHVTAARRLIGRYKGPGDKSAIEACVNRKAKAMGCDKEDEVEQSETFDSVEGTMHMLLQVMSERKYEKEPSLTDEDMKSLRDILKRLSTLVGMDAFASAAKEEKLGLDVVTEDAFCDHVTQLETQVGEVNDHLAALREEYQLLQRDMINLQDEHSDLQKDNRKNKEHLYTVAKMLTDGEAPATEDVLKMETSVLNDEFTRLSEKVDINTILDKLNDGMSRNPDQTVDDPTEVSDNGDDMNQQPEKPVLLDDVKLGLFAALFKGGTRGAQRFLSNIDLNKVKKDSE